MHLTQKRVRMRFAGVLGMICTSESLLRTVLSATAFGRAPLPKQQPEAGLSSLRLIALLRLTALCLSLKTKDYFFHRQPTKGALWLTNSNQSPAKPISLLWRTSDTQKNAIQLT